MTEALPSMSFDWIFFAIVAPWPILALWFAFVPGANPRPESTRSRL